MPKFSDEKKMLTEQFIKEKVFEEGCKLLKLEKPSLFSMRELAEAVGVSKGTLYNYFANKYEVVLFIDSILGQQGLQEVQEALESDAEPRAALLKFLHQALSARYTYRYVTAALRAIRQENLLMGKSIAASSLHSSLQYRQARATVINFLQRGIDAGKFKKETPELLDKYINAALEGISLYCSGNLEIEQPKADTIDKLLNLLVDGICMPEQ